MGAMDFLQGQDVMLKRQGANILDFFLAQGRVV